MRIVGGQHRGCVIEAPKGEGTRPTTDRVRESMMSSILSRIGSFEDVFVLDLFAGSGALGFEALSRGAAHALFCDIDGEALRTIKKNGVRLRLEDSAYRVSKVNGLQDPIPLGPKAYGLVFLDPPYRTEPEALFAQIKEARREGRFASGCLIVYEHDGRVAEDRLKEVFAEAELIFDGTKRYGKTLVDYVFVP